MNRASPTGSLLFGQFVFRAGSFEFSHPSFRRVAFGPLTGFVHEALQVHRLRFTCGCCDGLAIGHVLAADQALDSDGDIGLAASPCAGSIRDILRNLSGRYIGIVHDGLRTKLYTDAFASLPVVFSAERRSFASTTTINDAAQRWLTSEQLPSQPIFNLNEFCYSAEYLPAGLTAEPSEQRLLPNHSLDVESFKMARYWPIKEIAEGEDDRSLACRAADAVVRNLGRASRLGTIVTGVSGGRDSRILLAALLKAGVKNIQTYTFDYRRKTRQNAVDLHVAKKVTKALNVPWRTLRVDEPGELTRRAYFYNTGRCVSTNKAADFYRAASAFDSNAVWITGFGGEVAVAYFGGRDDTRESLSAEVLLARQFLPNRPPYLEAVGRWLHEAPDLSPGLLVELFYIENRLASWASAHTYGTAPFRFHFIPFCDFEYVDACLAMSWEFRKKRHSQREMMAYLEPRALQVPFEQFSGLLKGVWRVRSSSFGAPLRWVPLRYGAFWH